MLRVWNDKTMRREWPWTQCESSADGHHHLREHKTPEGLYYKCVRCKRTFSADIKDDDE